MFARSTLVFLKCLVLMGFATGCAVGGLPGKEEYAAIRAGKRAFVLLRVTAELKDGTEVAAFPSPLTGDSVSLGLGGFETGGEVRRASLPSSFLSTETHRQGWIYFILDPGIYYLAVQGGLTTDPATWVGPQRWRIDIPVGSRVAYAGTLHLKCWSKWYISGAKSCNVVEGIVVRNEQALAMTISAKYLADLGPPQTLLIQRHSGPIIIRTPK